MKLSIVKLASFAALLTPVVANFDVYMVEAHERVFGSYQQAWQIFEAQPSSCDAVRSAAIWFRSGDVSGDKEGVRCSGSGCTYTAPAGDIDVLEMNFSNSPKVWHWTLYKDRGYTMVGLDGNTYGNCIVFPNGDYDCDTNNGAQTLRGYRKFRCLTQYTVSSIFS
ncbi:hypothetical protein CJF30_00003885 [Rutstroemia sp. NJR-2017a BBW]|nr:hypothetical protein CJF30_00003885 [Rutstroemia sp. NJR-2017a BBW]